MTLHYTFQPLYVRTDDKSWQQRACDTQQL